MSTGQRIQDVIGITSLPSRTASAMYCSVSLFGVANTGTTFMDGYFSLFCGAPRTDANAPPGLTLAISFSAVLPSTVSATASSGGRFAIEVSSSVATT